MMHERKRADVYGELPGAPKCITIAKNGWARSRARKIKVKKTKSSELAEVFMKNQHCKNQNQESKK